MKYLTLLAFFLSSFTLSAQQQANLLGRWSDSTLIGSFAYNNTYNEVWGLHINGKEIAIIGSTDGTHFIDVTDPTQPTQIEFVAGKVQGGMIVHRDYHDYNGYLYAVCDEGPSSLQIIDITTLPDSVSVVYDSSDELAKAHNIFIDTATAKLYAFATGSINNGYTPLAIYDLSDPINPQILGQYGTFGGQSIGHVHDGYVKNDTAFLNCGGDGFYVVDCSDPNSIQTLGSLLTYQQQGYNHSGWPTDDGKYYFMADENHGKDIKVVSIEDFNDIEVKAFLNAGSTSALSMPHNQIVHDNKLYTAYYYDGLQVHDISDPLNPVRTHYYDTYTPPHSNSFEGAWGVFPFLPSGNILVSDMQSGLYVFQLGGGVNTTKFNQNVSINVFPQPFDDNINIKIETASKTNVSIQLFDMTGRYIQNFGNFELTNDEQTLNLTTTKALSSGIYILNIQGESINWNQKVVKK